MEYLDIINEKDEVVGRAEREDIYKKLLPHRIVHVLIFDSNNRMVLQLRSKTVTFCPNHWSTAVGNHVQAGETYEQAAQREMEEELSIKIPISLLSKELYADERGFNKMLGIFRADYDGSFQYCEDVKTARFFPLDEISAMIDRGDKFHPELSFILQKYYLK